MKKRVLITGATGMIGNIILSHCVQSDEVSEVISLVRRRTDKQHPKLKEIVLSDFTDYSAIASSLRNIDVAYFCVGVYTGAVPDAEFKKITV
ncbi:MAG TPA: NAD-dependent epimerase/dehydratase family protein, partial [Cyclobacteriaceae bacterium]|nr:NAD-dependent epimerase/dehydratase family protein [Cyclobacteriaceae bacterium]